MDPRRPEIRGEMAGCKSLAAFLACLGGLFLAALFALVLITATGVDPRW